MQTKYKTLEEVRRAAAERQKRWREKNKVLARERVAYVYGRAKYPQMVEARQRNSGKEEPFVINKPSITPKEENGEVEELRYVPTDEVEGDPVVMRRHAEEVRKRMGVVVEKRDPSEVKVVETENEKRTYAKLDELVRRKAPKEVVEVEM